MRSVRALFFRVAGLFNKQRREREMAQELESHLQLHIDDNLRAGMTPVEARRQALIKLGGIEQTKEIYRERSGIPLLEGIVQDIRYGLRMLAKSPGFTAVAILTLALGIGANTAIFTLIDSLLLESLPINEPDRLVAFSDPEQKDYRSNLYSYPEYVELRDHNSALAGLAATVQKWMTIESEVMPGAWVSGNYFEVLGIRALIGRTFSSEDERAGNAVVMLHYDLWKRRFGGDPAIVGKTVDVFHRPATVIGVLPPGFNSLDAGLKENFLVPIAMLRPLWGWDLEDPFPAEFRLFGRLKPGVSQAQAQASLAALFRHIRESFVTRRKWEQERLRRSYLERRIAVSAAGSGLPNPNLRMRFARPLGVLMAVVGLVLLIACVNIANLMLVRATARRREMAVRLALGAGRARLLQQMLTESFLLTGAGGAIGVLLAWWGCAAILDARPVVWHLSVELNISPGLRVLGFTMALALGTGFLFGLAPALQAFRVAVAPVLKDEGAAASGSRPALALRRGLIAAQVALSLLLVGGAGLFIRTLWNLEHVNSGIDRTHVVLFWLDDNAGKAFWDSTAAQREQVYRRILDRVESIPGVRSAALSSINFEGFSEPVAIGGRQADANTPKANVNWVNSRYFETLGMPIIRGRVWNSAQQSMDPVKVAVINQSAARIFFTGTDPVGRHVKVAGRDLEIVGVAGDTIWGDLRERAQPSVYPAGGGEYGALYVRTAIDPAAVVSAVRREVHQANLSFFVTQALTLDEYTRDTLTNERLMAGLTVVLAGLAAILTAIGLYGVVAWSVAHRTREIGIRVALGARRRHLVRLVLRDVLAPVVGGLALGVPVLLALAKLGRSLLYGVGPADPATITVTAVLMCAVAAGAAYLPARRATKVDPIVALRFE
jgi:predicted permease